jgi:hypothetical protein
VSALRFFGALPEWEAHYDSAVQLFSLVAELKQRAPDSLGRDFLLLAVSNVVKGLEELLDTTSVPKAASDGDNILNLPGCRINPALLRSQHDKPQIPAPDSSAGRVEHELQTVRSGAMGGLSPAKTDWPTVIARLLHGCGDELNLGHQNGTLSAVEIASLLDAVNIQIERIINELSGADIVRLLALCHSKALHENLAHEQVSFDDVELQQRRSWAQIISKVCERCRGDSGIRSKLFQGAVALIFDEVGPIQVNTTIASLLKVKGQEREDMSLSAAIFSDDMLVRLESLQLKKLLGFFFYIGQTRNLALIARILQRLPNPKPENFERELLRRVTDLSECHDRDSCGVHVQSLTAAWGYLYEHKREELIESCAVGVLDFRSPQLICNQPIDDWLDLERVGGTFRNAIARGGLFPDIFCVKNGRVTLSNEIQERVKERLRTRCDAAFNSGSYCDSFGAWEDYLKQTFDRVTQAGINCRGLLGNDEETLDRLIALCPTNTPIRPFDERLEAYMSHCHLIDANKRQIKGGYFGITKMLNEMVAHLTQQGEIPPSRWTPLTDEMFQTQVEENLARLPELFQDPYGEGYSKLFTLYLDPSAKERLLEDLAAMDSSPDLRPYEEARRLLKKFKITLEQLYDKDGIGHLSVGLDQKTMDVCVKGLKDALDPYNAFRDALRLWRKLHNYPLRQMSDTTIMMILGLVEAMIADRGQYELCARLTAEVFERDPTTLPLKADLEVVLRRYFERTLGSNKLALKDVERQFFGIWRHLSQLTACALAERLSNPSGYQPEEFIEFRTQQLPSYIKNISLDSALRSSLEIIADGGSYLFFTRCGNAQRLKSRIEGIFDPDGYSRDAARRPLVQLLKLKLHRITSSRVWVTYAGQHSALTRQGDDFIGIRQLAVGDDVTRLNVAATMRTGTPHVNQYSDRGELDSYHLIIDISALADESDERARSSRIPQNVGRLMALIHQQVVLQRWRDASICVTFAGDPILYLNHNQIMSLFRGNLQISDLLGVRTKREDLFLTLCVLASMVHGGGRSSVDIKALSSIPKSIVPNDHQIPKRSVVLVYCKNPVMLRASRGLFDTWMKMDRSEVSALEF